MSARKVAVVTGASAGLGRATAEALAARGYALVMSSRSPEAAAEHVRSAYGVEAVAVAASIDDPGLPARLADAARGLGRCEALLLNHGGPKVSSLMELADDDWTTAFGVMVRGPLAVLRAIVPLMRAGQGGRVLAVSSFTVKAPYAGIALSNSLRAALVNALKTAALELGPEGILVNSLAPGYVETDRIRNWNASFAARRGTTPQGVADETIATIPLRRYGTPDGYARLAAFLLSEENDYVSGQQLLYDGGLITAN